MLLWKEFQDEIRTTGTNQNFWSEPVMEFSIHLWIKGWTQYGCNYLGITLVIWYFYDRHQICLQCKYWLGPYMLTISNPNRTIYASLFSPLCDQDFKHIWSLSSNLLQPYVVHLYMFTVYSIPRSTFHYAKVHSTLEWIWTCPRKVLIVLSLVWTDAFWHAVNWSRCK